MFIDDQKRSSRLLQFRSPFPLALLAFIGCGLMVLGLIKRPDIPTVAASPFPSTGALHAATLFSDQRLVFLLLLGGFVLMAGGCFVLSRRSFRDTLKAESQRTN